MILGSICLSDIPKDRITEGKNGKKYLDIMVVEKYEGVDQWGNTHAIACKQTREEIDAKAKKIYLGNGKEYSRKSYTQGEAKVETAPSKGATKKEAPAPSTAQGEDDLPF